jgi:hypothetical protein
MAGWYVRVPIGSHLAFPAQCPFTGKARPTRSTAVSRSEKLVGLPLPWRETFRRRRVEAPRFPVSSMRARAVQILAALPWAMVIGGVGLMYHFRGSLKGTGFLLGGLMVGILCRGLLWFWLRRARIVSIGTTTLELRFASEQYAREFCQLNELSCGRERLRKRARPMIGNETGRRANTT